MGKLIAVKGAILDSNLDSAQYNITTEPSSKSFIQGLGIYRGVISVSVLNGKIGSTTSISGVALIQGSALETLSDSLPVILEGDSSIETPMKGVSSSGNPVTVMVTVKIASAGQNLVEGK